MRGTGLVALCACASVFHPAAAAAPVSSAASSVIVDIAKAAASADRATAMHRGSARRAGEPLAVWLARLDEWLPVPGTAASETPPSGTVDVVCRTDEEDTFRLRFDDPRAVSFQGQTGTLRSAQRLVVLPSSFLGAGAVAACDVRTAFYHEADVFAGVAGDGEGHGFAAGGGGSRSLRVPADAVPRTEKRVGPPSEVHNLVILAAGYTEAERPKWEADLAKAVGFFVNPPGQEYIDHMPLYRYYDAVNVFSVWQPSPESGATIPPGPVVNDNLGCSYNTAGIERLLVCDFTKSLELAETTDAKPQSQNTRNVVALTLVNSAKYGGSGSYLPGFKRGAFYASSEDTPAGRDAFAAIMFHELAHGWTDIADEYDSYETDGAAGGSNTNCAGPDLLRNLPWQHLIDAGLVPATPLRGCTYPNWYRATSQCLMYDLKHKALCPVCREQMTLALYNTPTFSTTWPSCPLPDEVVHVAVGGSVRLHANSKLTLKGNFDLTWELVPARGDAVPLCRPCGADVEVPASALQAGLNTVRVTVADTTPWVFTKPASMTQSRTFTLKLVDRVDTANLRSRRCYCADESAADCRGGANFFSNGGAASDVAYYSECDAASGECELHTTAYERSLPDTPVPTPEPTPEPTPPPAGCRKHEMLEGATGTFDYPEGDRAYAPLELSCFTLPCAGGDVDVAFSLLDTTDLNDNLKVFTLAADGTQVLQATYFGRGSVPEAATYSGDVFFKFESNSDLFPPQEKGFTFAWVCNVQTPATDAPTDAPTDVPTSVPTSVPTDSPTDVPTDAPTPVPTSAPTDVPTSAPTDAPIPTDAPTAVPTTAPTSVPTDAPTSAPTDSPTVAPSGSTPAFPGVCGASQQVLPPASGTLAHPGDGGKYGHNENLCWMLQCSLTATLDWLAFATEKHHDFVEVYALGSDGQYTRVFRESGRGVKRVQHDGTVVVRFASDAAKARQGFRAAYACAPPRAAFEFPKNCRDKYALSGETGSIEHPAGEAEYTASESKCWHVPCAGTLRLTWTEFETESGYDHVTLYETPAADTETAAAAAALGGAGLAKVWRKSGVRTEPFGATVKGGALIRFRSDHSVSARGFTVGWTCTLE